jgi:hypothetical protein
MGHLRTGAWTLRHISFCWLLVFKLCCRNADAGVASVWRRSAYVDDDDDSLPILDGGALPSTSPSPSTFDDGVSIVPTNGLDNTTKNNLLFILVDQLRWDALGFVQKGLPQFKGKFLIQTPNIDRLARLGVVFSNAYCVSPSCVPSRSSIRTGTTVRRTGMNTNKLYHERVYKKMKIFRDRVEAMQSFEQLLVEEYAHFDLSSCREFSSFIPCPPCSVDKSWQSLLTQHHLTCSFHVQAGLQSLQLWKVSYAGVR